MTEENFTNDVVVELKPLIAPQSPLNVVDMQDLQNEVIDELCVQVSRLKEKIENDKP
jgi:hypothetical protein